MVINQELVQRARKEFSSIAAWYGGRCEMLYGAAAGSTSVDVNKAHQAWEATVTQEPNLSQLWDHVKAQARTPQEQSQTWMGILQSWGLQRGNTEPFVLTEASSIHYDPLDFDIVSPEALGKEVRVLVPNWQLGQNIIQKGVVSQNLSSVKKALPHVDYTHLINPTEAKHATKVVGREAATAAREADTWISRIEGMASGKKWAAGTGAIIAIAGAGWTWHEKHRNTDKTIYKSAR